MRNFQAMARKKLKIRKTIAKQDKYRLTVYKSNKHIYAQLFKSDGSSVITSMSSLDKTFKDQVKLDGLQSLSKIEQATLVGVLLAAKIKSKDIRQVVFDRSGFKFHGRIKAIADSISNNGVVC